MFFGFVFDLSFVYFEVVVSLYHVDEDGHENVYKWNSA